MLRSLKVFSSPKRYAILIFLFIMVFAKSSNAEEPIEDLIDIFDSNGKIVAVIEGKKPISFNLSAKENVLWRGSKGDLAVFLTNNRFFVISTTSGSWQYFKLRSDEPEDAMISLSPSIALVAFEDRVIGYLASSNQFIETQIPVQDERVFVGTDEHVAVIVTSNSLLGITEKSSSFIEARLRIRESIEDVKTSSNRVTVRTSERLLSFTNKSTTWNSHKL